jgi:DNA invertase Pin-like site-specific DNA recombinase
MQKSRAVAYLRVSTEKQVDQGISLKAQRAKVESYAELYELELVEVVIDAGASAKTLDRPGLRKALEMLRTGQADAFLVAKLDRLTRSVVHLGQLVEDYFADGRFALLSVGEQIDTRSAAGRLVLNVLASVSQWEREAIGERTAAAMQHKATLGEYCGGKPPFGFAIASDGDHLVENPAEQEVLAAVRKLRSGGHSFRAVARELSARGFRSRSGTPFSHMQVVRMVAA